MKITETRPVRISEDELHELREDGGGFCLACGAQVSNIEPDACAYDCDDCGERQVFGCEELLIAGLIEIEV